MKICVKCKTSKPLIEFYNHKNAKDGKRNDCITCKKLDYEINKNARLEQRRIYRETNKEEIREKQKVYRATNRNILSEKGKLRAVLPENRARIIFNSARSRARKTNREFDLTIEGLRELLKVGICFATGFRLDFNPSDKSLRNPLAPSIDRRDNTKGYTTENIQLVCNMYNCGKGEANEIDFIAMCLAVAEHNRNNVAAHERLKELRDAGL